MQNVIVKIGKMLKKHGVLALAMLFLCSGCSAENKTDCECDHNIREYPTQAGETDDAPRILRAIKATPNGVLTIPRGTYRIATPIVITNNCSLKMNKNTILKAVAPMETVVSIVKNNQRANDYSIFARGGIIDGNGMASCLRLEGFAHYTLSDMTLLNGKCYGLRVDGGYETICNNVYAKCIMSGLAGNTGFLIRGGDSHYTDCIVVDYTVGFDLQSGGSNRLTRCHVWGGPVPPRKPGEVAEMLKNSVNFRIGEAGSSNILRDCYADTGLVGYEIHGAETRLLGCTYFNNTKFKLDDITVIKHTGGRLLVSEGAFFKSAKHMKVYDGCGSVEWRDMFYWGWAPEDDCPGALHFKPQNADNQPVPRLAE